MAKKNKYLFYFIILVRKLLLQFSVFLVLYVLSIGPMFWKWHAAIFMDGSKMIASFYYPLMRACDESETIRDIVNWYVDLWIL